MKQILSNDWNDYLAEEFSKDYYQKLRQFLIKEYHSRVIYPDMHDIFNALHYTSYADTKVVILGQDPYHGPKQAHGLSFSVRQGVAIPPSLLNIYKELHDDLGCYIPNNGYLKPWADQGVLLLNATLTVRQGVANSHSKILRIPSTCISHIVLRSREVKAIITRNALRRNPGVSGVQPEQGGAAAIRGMEATRTERERAGRGPIKKRSICRFTSGTPLYEVEKGLHPLR